MAEAIQLMAVAVFEPALRLCHGEVDVEIAVVPLVLFDPIDHSLNLPLQCGVRCFLQQVCRAFDPLCNVGIPEDVRLRFVAALGPTALERLKAARVRKAVVHGMDGYVADQFLLLGPEAAGDVGLLKCDGFKVLHKVLLLTGLMKYRFLFTTII